MYRTIFITFFGVLCFAVSAFSQDSLRYYVNKQPIDSLGVPYITIHATPRLFSDIISVQLEYGQLNKIFANKETRIADASGKEVVFNSMLEVLNLLASQGYEYIDSFMDPTSNDGRTLKFLLKRVK